MVRSSYAERVRSIGRGWGLVLGLALGCGGGKGGSAPGPGNGFVTDDDAGRAPPTVVKLDCHTSLPSQDADGDGYSPERGDCDDCVLGLGPAALDFPGNGIDEDCDGTDATEPEPTCDEKIDARSTEADDAARAIGLCRFAQGTRDWGVISARWLRLDGTKGLEDPLQVWQPEAFGSVMPRDGARVLVMSTGVARDERDAAYTRECDTFSAIRAGGSGFTQGSAPPSGYPKDSSRCGSGVVSTSEPAYNDVSLEVKLRAPSNATALSFDSMFFTYEYPDFVCSSYNDFFVVFTDPKRPELRDQNVLFDEDDNPIGVNTGLLRVCRKSDRPARSVACADGPALLAGTGYDKGEATCGTEQSNAPDIGGASTGWLVTTIPVQPGKIITLRFLLWDSGDPLLDSSAVIDHVRWSVETPEAPSTRPITQG